MPIWHPSHNAIEQSPGIWYMPDPLGDPYAIIRLLQIGPDIGYRVTTYQEPRELIGYYTTLRASCWAANQWYIRSRHGRDIPNPGWE